MKKKSAKQQAWNNEVSVHPKTPRQQDYWNELSEPLREEGQIVIASGSAGTGKSYLAVAKACELYLAGDIDRIVLCRPLVESSEGQSKLGALPGSIGEKVDPWLNMSRTLLTHFLGTSKVECDWDKRIVVQPLALMRGMSYDNVYLVCEEAQNMPWSQVKMLTTRIGKYSKLILCGDDKQVDLPLTSPSGFVRLIEEIERQQAPIEIIKFRAEDNQRSGASRMMVELFDKAE